MMELNGVWDKRAVRSILAATLAMLIAALGGLSLGGCATGSATSQLATAATTSSTQAAQSPATSNVSAKVALLLPLSATGHPAVVAKGMKQAAEMALFENNNPGFRLIVKDTRGTPEGATAAATAALADGAELIIGPLFAKSVTAASQIARQGKVPVIAFSNDQRVAGNGTYLLSFLAQEEVDRIVSFAASQGKRRFAALVPENDYGKLLEAAFRDSVSRSGGVIIALERHPAGAGGVLGPARTLVDAVKSADETGATVDALFLPGGPETLSSLGPIITHAKLDLTRTKLLGSGGWDYPNLGRDAAFIGGWYPAPDPRGWQAFSEKFTKTFGSAPPRIASLAHNAVTIAIRLAASNPKGTRYTTANLTRANGFIGVDGAVRFTARGTPQRGLAVLEVGKFGPRVVAPASRTFRGYDGRQATTGSIRYN